MYFIIYVLLYTNYSNSFSFNIFGKNNKTNAKCCVYFTPYDNCTNYIVKEIKNAKKEIYIIAFAFTCEKIMQALIDAHKRGVKIIILIDKKYVNHHTIRQLHETGIPIYIDKAKSHAHNKIIIIDCELVLTGSFNFTYNAQNSNNENSVHIHSKEINKQYKEYFNKRYNQNNKINLK